MSPYLKNGDVCDRDPQSVAAAAPRTDRGSPLHGRSIDARNGIGRRSSWAEVQDDDSGRDWDQAPGSRPAQLPGDTPQSALGCRSDLRSDLARLRVRGLRDRRVLAAHRGMASVELVEG